MRYGLRASLLRFKYSRDSQTEFDSWFRIQDFICNFERLDRKTVQSNTRQHILENHVRNLASKHELNRLVQKYISNLNSFSGKNLSR